MFLCVENKITPNKTIKKASKFMEAFFISKSEIY